MPVRLAYAKRDMRSSCAAFAEYGFDIGCIQAHIRRHDQNLVRLQIRMSFKQVEQVIAQHFDFPQGAMAAVHAYRAIVIFDSASGASGTVI